MEDLAALQVSVATNSFRKLPTLSRFLKVAVLVSLSFIMKLLTTLILKGMQTHQFINLALARKTPTITKQI
jgi:hypothetical protein